MLPGRFPLASAGNRKRRHLWLVAAALTAGCLCVFAAREVHGLWRPDGFDYAQIARELAAGRGFSSRQVIYELHLRFLKDHGLLQAPWPNLHRFPLPSLAMAGLFLLTGPRMAGVLIYGIVCAVATSVLLFCWARRALGTAPAFAAVALFSFNGTVLEGACTGMAEPITTLFFTLSLFLGWRAGDDDRAIWPFSSGVALGLAALGRTNAILAAPALLVAIALQVGGSRPRLPLPWRAVARRAALVVLGTTLVLTPWLVRNWRVTGSPTFSLHSYFLVPAGTLPPETGNKWDASLPWVRDFVSPVDYIRSHPAPVLEKWERHVRRFLDDFPTLGGVRALPVIALLGLLLPAGRNLRPMAWVLVSTLAVTVVLVSLTDEYVPRYYDHFLPPVLLLGLGIVWQALRRIPWPRLHAPLLFIAVLVMAEPAKVAGAAERAQVWSSRVDPAQMAFVRQHTREDAVIFSDISWVVTWETGRRSVRSHFDWNPDGTPTLAVLRFNEEFLPIDAVYLRFQSAPIRKAYRNLKTDPRFQKLFPHRRRFPDGAVFWYR